MACPTSSKPFVGDYSLRHIFCTKKVTFSFVGELELLDPFVKSFHNFATTVNTLGFGVTRPFFLPCVV
jgi:hypothetical protein